MIFIHDVKRAYLKHYQVLCDRGVKRKCLSQKCPAGLKHV